MNNFDGMDIVKVFQPTIATYKNMVKCMAIVKISSAIYIRCRCIMCAYIIYFHVRCRNNSLKRFV